MTETQFILSDQIEGYPHPKFTKTLFGHETKEKEFIDCYKSGKLHHGWLITGARGIGKATLAWRLAKFILTQPVFSIFSSFAPIRKRACFIIVSSLLEKFSSILAA